MMGLVILALRRLILVWASAYLAYRLILALSLWLYPLPLQQLEQDYSRVHLDSRGQLLRLELSPSHKYRVYLPLQNISPYLRQGFLAYEDKYFYYHQGVNPWALVQALAKNTRAGRIRRGGSTLSMQLAKLLAPKKRTLAAKLGEMIRAVQLEGVYSKNQLLELYLNRVPLGGNIEGVGAASYLYFGKPAAQLSFSEACLLIGMPKSPNRFRPDLHPGKALAQRTRVIKTIARQLGVSQRGMQAGEQAALPAKRLANPNQCPQLQIRTKPLSGMSVRTYTIDPALQMFCEKRLEQAKSKFFSQGIHNAAILAVNNRSMEVLAYVGTMDFKDQEHGGQVNAAHILRSPGSLLKPFLYARAMQAGRLTPLSLVYDLPKNYDGYAPANFDRQCRGPITAEEALVLSLNNPAIQLEAGHAADGLAALLRQSKIDNQRLAKADPGLSVVLGAFPMSLEELVRLYTVFSNAGRLRGLCFFKEEAKHPNRGEQLLSPEACFMVTTILSQLMRPDLPQSWEFTPNRGRVAYKTGTSFGLRDAWAIGFTPEYTVGVWLGNVDASGSSSLVGSKVAAPLMIEVINELTRYQDSWFAQPAGVSKRQVCALSGEVAGGDCPNTREDYFIPGISSAQKCTVHARIFLDRGTGHEVCKACMDKPQSAYAGKVVEEWPPDVAAFLRQQGRLEQILPRHNPACSALYATQGLKISSPLPGGEYRVTSDLAQHQQKIALTAQSQRISPIFWYVDGFLVGRGQPEESLFIHPVPGRHQALAVNGLGQSDQVIFQVGR